MAGIARVRDFRPGLQTHLAPTDLPDGATPYCGDVVFSRGTLRVRPGRAIHSSVPTTVPALEYAPRAMCEYVNPDLVTEPVGTPVGHQTSLICAIGTAIYGTGTATQTFSTALDFSATVGSGRVRMAQFGQYVYVCDGTNSVQRLDPTVPSTTAIADSAKPTVAPYMSGVPVAGAGGSDPLNPGADTFLAAGGYTFGISYYWTSGDTEGPILLSNSRTIGDGRYQEWAVFIEEDAGLAPAPDSIQVWSNNPYTNDEWQLLESITYGSGSPYTRYYDSTELTSTTTRGLLFNKPPTATILYPWSDRMCFTSAFPGETGNADTLFLSNYLDAESIPIDAYVMGITMDDSWGTYVRIGKDGSAITGLFGFGGYLLVFKERGIWQLEGGSPADFLLTQISTQHGCVSHEAICRLPNGVAFLGNDSIWLYDGDRFQDLGQPVRSFVSSYGKARLAKAYAVYNPQTERAHFVVPES